MKLFSQFEDYEFGGMENGEAFGADDLLCADVLRAARACAGHVFFASKQIEQFEKDPKRLDLTPPAEPPDGPPIGAIGDVDDDWM